MSPPASLSFKGQATKQATVKWFIELVASRFANVLRQFANVFSLKL